MEKKVYVELPPFTGRNVPITEIAAAMHKDAQYVRIGLQQGNRIKKEPPSWQMRTLGDSTNGSCRVTITQQGYYSTTAAKFNNYLRRNRI